jgi:hypothetical protein
MHANDLMTFEEYCRTVARQVLLDERMELPKLWREVYRVERISLEKHFDLYRLAGFQLESFRHEKLRIRHSSMFKKDAFADELLTHDEFFDKYFCPPDADTPAMFSLVPTVPYAGRLVPRVCGNCKKPAACRCICNEAYCSRACQEAHWPSHRGLHSEQRMNEPLFTLTKVYWAEQLGLRD